MSIDQLTADQINKSIQEKGLDHFNYDELSQFKRLLREDKKASVYIQTLIAISEELRERDEATK